MAKKRRVNVDRGAAEIGVSVTESAGFDPLRIATGLLGGLIVYVAYHPSDSVAVETGDALWFAFLSIAIATIAIGFQLRPEQSSDAGDPFRSGDKVFASGRIRTWWPDLLVWLLAAWMLIAAWGSCPPGNLRQATNEAWLWVSAAAVFTAARRLLAIGGARRAVFALLIVCGCGLAVHAMHQYWVSLPQARQRYIAEPEEVLKDAELVAPPGSTERMVFENRLFDGGPTGSFALANSLAAPLLIACVVAVGVLRLCWPSITGWQRVAWALVLIVCGAALLSTRSRSAILAVMMAVFFLFVAGSRLLHTDPKRLVIGLLVISVFAAATVFGIAVFGNPEWFEEAPASLAFRFQYWRSTAQMVADRPLFGAGPGNFQAIYERYREPSASEQIAEPHNFLFETLGSGGIVAAVLLITMIAIGVWIAWVSFFRFGPKANHRQTEPEPNGQENDLEVNQGVGANQRVEAKQNDDANPEQPVAGQELAADVSAAQWIWLGAVLGLLMVWVIGFAIGFLPDFDANMMVIPIGIGAAFALWPSLRKISDRDLDLIAAVALTALMIHLLISGGWTVPGVAILCWLLFASLTRYQHNGVDQTEPPLSLSPLPRYIVLATGALLLLAVYLYSIRPVGERSRAFSLAAYCQANDQLGRAKRVIDRAIDSDPWSADASAWVANFYRWKLILDRDSASVRDDWEEMIAESMRRAGEDPAFYRVIGAQQIHLYQRYGQDQDLQAAAQTFEMALRWSPANEWMFAQVAAIREAQGKVDEAKMLAERALELSLSGGNIERSLDRKQIYVPQVQGVLAETGPVRRPATELLANHLPPPDVTDVK